jgi:nucleotide-binding universal stress UspA family protein
LASAVVPQHARYADLCILGQEPAESAASMGYTFPEQLLFLTGRPILFVPASGDFATLGRHIVVAWNASRPAARSVNDAMALIERAERITVLMVNPSKIIDWPGAVPGERLVEHLSRHGATAGAIRIDNVRSDSVADALLANARAVGGDLVVAGAFGHPRLWEKLLGGVTADLLARMDLPVLMSH